MPETSKDKTSPPVVRSKPQSSFMGDWFLQYYKLATGGACLLVLGLGYWLLISPKIEKVQNIASTVLREEQTKQAALKVRIEYLVNLETLRNQIAEEDITRIGQMLPSEPGVPELFASLESIALESFVKLENIQFSKLETKKDGGDKRSIVPGGAEALEIQLTVANTPYSNVKTLVTNIETSLRLLDVMALLYSPAAKTYSLTVRSYYLP